MYFFHGLLLFMRSDSRAKSNAHAKKVLPNDDGQTKTQQIDQGTFKFRKLLHVQS